MDYKQIVFGLIAMLCSALISFSTTPPVRVLAYKLGAIDIPIDIHTENPKSTGGFIRHYEVPEMIRIAAPIYLKPGGSVAATHSWDSTEDDARKRAKQCALVKRMIDSYYPEAIWSPKGSLI